MKRAIALLLAALVLTPGGPADAQTRGRRSAAPLPPRPVHRPRHIPQARRTKKAQPRASLTRQLGTSVARELLSSDEASDRERALERLGSVGTPRALEVVVEALEPGGRARTARERLVAVRALARHADSATVRQALVRAMTGVGGDQRQPSGLAALVRENAALALAASGEPEAYAALGTALRHEGPAAEAAMAAVVAHPPQKLDPLLASRGAATTSLVEVLARLSDQRAFEPLRQLVQRGTPEVRARAAVALTELGDLETVPLARHWLKHEKIAALRIAAVRILALARAPGFEKAIVELLKDDATSSVGMRLALLAPHPRLAQGLAAELEQSSQDRARSLLAAIGRAGGADAARLLGAQLEHAELGKAAAYALALSVGDDASRVLEAALERPKTRRLAARAAVIRTATLGVRLANTEQVLEQLVASGEPADRAVGAWGLSVLRPGRAAALIGSRDLVMVRAAARAAPAAGALAAAAKRLGTETDAATRTALAIGLADLNAANQVPTAILVELVDGDPAAGPLAARALAARDSSATRARIEELLVSTDASMRAHTALGLGHSKQPGAAGLLDRAYRFESDAGARHAMIVALSRLGARRTLALAARLDADAAVRSTARMALAGHGVAVLPKGSATAWLEIAETPAAAGKGPGGRAASIQISTGLGLPITADPDGIASITGLPSGAVRLRLADGASQRKARRTR